MLLAKLPKELLLLIAQNLNERDLNCFLRTNSVLKDLLTPLLHEYATQVPKNGYKGRYQGIDVEIHCILRWAAFKGYEGLFRLLLDKDHDINCDCPLDQSKGTCLHFAALQGSEAIIRIILSSKTELNEKDSNGRTPLHNATIRGYKSVVQLLLEAGADVGIKDKWEVPVLCLAVIGHYHYQAQWDTGVIQLLVEHHADINARDQMGATALHIAIASGDTKVIDSLLELGADTTVKCNIGETAIEWALNQLSDPPRCKEKSRVEHEAPLVVKFLQEKELIPCLERQTYDVRKPKGKLEYWYLACGKGWRNKVKIVVKALRHLNPTSGLGGYWRKGKMKKSRLQRRNSFFKSI